MRKKVKDKKETGAGYYYYPSEEMLESFSQLTTEQRLMWLYEATSFLHAVASPETKRTWAKLRRGKELKSL